MNMNVSQMGMFRCGSRAAQNAYANDAWMDRNQNAGEDKGKSVASIKRMLSKSQQEEQKSFQNVSNTNLRDSTYGYSDSVREARTKAKDTALQLKKLRYDFKAISTQILRSKTSANAKQVAARARREVIRLKRQRQNGEYDDEELQSAITHAQAIERAARKKARHLEEEEMVKVAGGPCAAELEEKEEAPEDAERGLEAAAASGTGGNTAPDAARLEEDIPQNSGAEELQTAVQDMMSELMQEMSDSMRDLMEEMGLSELTDSMFTAKAEMDPADLKMMKLKHRSEEMKAIAEADAEYLKALFDRLERAKQAAVGGSAVSAGVGAAGAGGVSMPMHRIDIVSAPGVMAASMPGMSGAAAAEGGGIDISV